MGMWLVSRSGLKLAAVVIAAGVVQAEAAKKDLPNILVINPLFPALRSGPTAASGASLQKQTPSSLSGDRKCTRPCTS